MTATIQPLASAEPDAGVIRRARRRQRRHRAIAVATAVAAVLVPIVWSAGGGGDHSQPLAQPAPATPAALTACAVPPTTSAPLDPSLLSLLGVLRRPAAPSDALPGASLRSLAMVPASQVFVNYVRRARELSGQSYYVVAVRFEPCGTRRAADTVSLWVFSAKEAYGVGGGSAAIIAQRGLYDSRGTGVGAQTSVVGLVPDGVASATLHYPATPSHGAGHPSYAATTLNAPAVDNVVLFPRAPRGPGLGSNATLTWHAADGTIIKTIRSGDL
jgi:hypothetical protein